MVFNMVVLSFFWLSITEMVQLCRRRRAGIIKIWCFSTNQMFLSRFPNLVPQMIGPSKSQILPQFMRVALKYLLSSQ